jgi:hypothetical protein
MSENSLLRLLIQLKTPANSFLKTSKGVARTNDQLNWPRFSRFLAANLGKNLDTQTFRTKKFSFYVAKHKNWHHCGQFN